MRIGIVIPPDRWWPEQRRRWQAAEAYGFAHAWTLDRLHGPAGRPDGPWLSAVPTLACAAGWTERIRLGTLVSTPAARHPVPFARDLVTLDDVSGGRLVLGLGAGDGGDEQMLGERSPTGPDRDERFAEFVDLLDALLTAQGSTTHHGRWFTSEGAALQPGCVQWPRVPFVVGANEPTSLAVAARHGQGWVTAGGIDGEWWDGVRERADRLDQALAAQDRPREEVDRYLDVDTRGPVRGLSSVDAFEDLRGRAGEAGYTDLLVHWPPDDDTTVLDAVAADLPGER